MTERDTGAGSHARVREYTTERYNRPGSEALRERLAVGAAVLQRPLDTLLALEECGADIPAAVWNIAEPQLVTRLYTQGALAGADILATTTARANEAALRDDEIHQSVAAVNRAAVDCARAAEGHPLVVGTVGSYPYPWAAHDEAAYRAARAAYREQAYALLVSGTDGLWLSGFASLHDLDPAREGVLDVAADMPVLLSVACAPDGTLAGDGASLADLVASLPDHGVDAVGIEMDDSAAATQALARLSAVCQLPTFVCAGGSGAVEDPDGFTRWADPDSALTLACRAWVAHGACAICTAGQGTPRDLVELAEARDERQMVRSA